MRNLVCCFTRKVLFSSLLVVFCLFEPLVLNAQETRAQLSAAQLNRFVQNNPQNRPARWALSQVAFQAGQFDIARHHVERLLQTSMTDRDVGTLTRALAKITAADPWDFELGFALLPSTNIRRYTYNDEFVTLLGVFTPAGGGEVESGVGVSLGAGFSYRLSLPDKSRLTLRARIDQSIYDISELNQTALLLAARRDSFAIGRSTTVEPYLRFRFTEVQKLARRDVGVNLSTVWWLKNNSQFSAATTIEYRDYLEQNVFDGPFGRLSLRYRHTLDDQTSLGIGVALARSDPKREHLKYWERQASADATRRFQNIGSFGLFGSYTARVYDGIFPATGFARKDAAFAVGISYQPDRFQVFGSRPRVSCQTERNSSNIALYDYKTTDCRLTFERTF